MAQRQVLDVSARATVSRAEHPASSEARRWPLIVFGLVCSSAVAFGLPLAVESPVPDGPFGTWGLYRRVAGHSAEELRFVLTGWGMVGWLWAWSLLRQHPQRWLRVAVLLWGLPHLVAPPAAGDVYNYVEQGWVVLHGGNPTTMPSGSVPGPFSAWVGDWAGTTVGYPPFALYAQAGMVWLANESPWLSLMMMRLLGILGVALMVVACTTLSKRFGVNPHHVLWFLAVNPFIILEAVTTAHNDALATGLVAAGVATALASRHQAARVAPALLLLIIGGLVKPNALVLGALWPLALAFGLELKGRVTQLKALVLAGTTTGVLLATCVGVSWLPPLGITWLRPSGDPSWASNSLYSIWVGLSAKVDSAIPVVAHFNGVVMPHGRVLCALVILLGMLGLALFSKLTLIASIPVALLALSVLIGPAGRAWYLLPAFVALLLTGVNARLLATVTATVSVWQMPRFWTPFSYLSAQLWSWLGAALCAWVLSSWHPITSAQQKASPPTPRPPHVPDSESTQ